MLSSPLPLNELLPNLVFELLTYIGFATAKKMRPTPQVGSKGQI